MKSSATDLLRSPLELALCVLLIALVAVTFSQVLFRYVLQVSLAWSEELARFFLLWLGSLSAAYAFKTGSHFALRFAVDRLPAGPRKQLAWLVTALIIALLTVFAWQALKFTLEVRAMVAPATGMSMAVPYSSAFVGSVLMLYYVLRQAWHGDGEPDARSGH
jgi:TRAP-type C4-dicarboxylate transport system permease small subunit